MSITKLLVGAGKAISIVRKVLGKATDLLNKGRAKGYWEKGQGPDIGGPKDSLIVVLAILGLMCAAACGPITIPGPQPNPQPQPQPTQGPGPTVPVTVPTPLPSTPCTVPQGVEWIGPGPELHRHDAVLNAVMASLTECSPGSDCNTGYGAGDEGAQRWFRSVVSSLQSRGFCAGQHETGITDEIAVAEDCTGPYAGYHISNYGSGKVVWAKPAGHANRPSWIPSFPQGAPLCASLPYPQPSPEPTHPSPGPSPQPPGVGPGTDPSPSVCDLVLDADHFLTVRVKEEAGARLRVDATDFYCGFPLPEGWSCGTKCCALGVDAGPKGVACEQKLFGTPAWSTDSPELGITVSANPFTAFLSGTGTAKVCGGNAPDACGTYTVGQ